MGRAFAFIVIFVASASSADAGTQCSGTGPELRDPAICSRMFGFSGRCGEAKYDYPNWQDIAFAVGAWEKSPIRIVSVSLDIEVQHTGWWQKWWKPIRISAFAGNSFNADPLTPMSFSDSETIHITKDYPLDLAMQFPTGEPMPQTHLDVHLSCSPLKANYSGSLVVWYKLDELTH